MGVLLLIALLLLAFLCLVIGVAAVLPLRLELELHKEAEWRIAAAIRPFGLYGPLLPFSNKQRHAKPTKTVKPKRRVLRHTSSRVSATAVLRLLTDVLGCIRIGHLTVNAQFGLGDPAATGQAFGMLAPVIYGTSATPSIQVRAVPVFDRAVLSGAAEMAFFVIPITLLGPAIRFGWSVIRPAR